MVTAIPNDILGQKFVARVRQFADAASDMDAVVLGEAADMIETLLQAVGSAHVALINRDRGDTDEGNALMRVAVRDVAQALDHVRTAEAEL